MAYGEIRTDRLHGSDNNADLISIKYQVSGTDTAIENGNVVLIGALETGSREVFLATAPAADSVLGDIAIVAEPEVEADERKKTFGEFRVEAGKDARAYILRSGDIFSVTVNALTAINGTAPAKDQLVELQAANKLKLVASATIGSTQVGKVIAIEGKWIVIRVA